MNTMIVYTEHTNFKARDMIVEKDVSTLSIILHFFMAFFVQAQTCMIVLSEAHGTVEDDLAC